MHEAIRSSCEVFFCELSSRLGIARLTGAARAMGLGAPYDVGLSEEKAGVVPDPDWKRGNLNAAWFGGETLLTGLGQGYMQATPLQLAVMAARIASGLAVAPVLRKRDAASAKPALGTLPFDRSHFDAVRQGMIAVVNDEGGSAEKAKLGDGKPLLAGKTGTSPLSLLATEVPDESVEWAKRNQSLFIGYEPAEAPRYAIANRHRARWRGRVGGASGA